MATSISPYIRTSWINNSAPNIQADLLNNIENNLFNVIELSNSLCNEINSIQNNRLILTAEERTRLDEFLDNPLTDYKNVQVDWNETNSNSYSYIKNVPNDLVHDSTYQIAVRNKIDGISLNANKVAVSELLQSGVKIGTITITNASNVDTVYTLKVPADIDTKNTTGALNTTDLTKLYFVMAAEQSTNPITYTNSNLYMTSSGLVVNGKTMADLTSTQAFTNKTYNGLTLTSASTGFTISGGTTSRTLTVNKTLTLGDAAARAVADTSITQTGTALVSEKNIYANVPRLTAANNFTAENNFKNVKIDVNPMATSGIDKELYDSLNSLGMLDVFDTITFNLYIGSSTSIATSCTAVQGQSYDKWAVSSLNTSSATKATGGTGTTGTVILQSGGRYRISDSKILSNA